MTMTREQRDVLAHVVIDPDAWFADAVRGLGQEAAELALEAKVARWSGECAAERARLGKDYKTREQRETASPQPGDALRNGKFVRLSELRKQR